MYLFNNRNWSESALSRGKLGDWGTGGLGDRGQSALSEWVQPSR